MNRDIKIKTTKTINPLSHLCCLFKGHIFDESKC